MPDLCSTVTDRHDFCVRPEFVDDLPAGAAGGGGFGVGVKTTTARITERPSAVGDGLEDGVPLGTDRQAVRRILDVAAREDLATIGEHGRPDAKPAVGTIGV